jgi:23S rRNA (uracil1939-C5)-methyltransferase
MKRRRRQLAAKRPERFAQVQIEKPIYGGAFLAHLEGKASFVPLTLPGEEARVRIVEDKRSYATAEPETIVSPSPDRIQPRCPHFGVCGGCSYQHATYEAQLALKEQILRETLQRAAVPPPAQIDILAGEPWAYRNRIRLAFDASRRAGYRGRRSRDIFPIQECPITAPLLVKAALSAAEILREQRPAFNASELSLFCNADETAFLASIFISKPAINAFDTFATTWKQRLAELAGIECVLQSFSDQPSQQLARWGDESIPYRAAGFDYRVDHGSFFQVNRWLLDPFVERVVADHRGTLAWDLFAGVGLFARKLAQRFDQVVAVESAPSSRHALEQNLQGTTARPEICDALSFLKAQLSTSPPDLIVVDPPRAGLGPDVTALLGHIGAPTLIYVSCDPSTLARDLKALLASGYSIASVALVDLFPQTFHLETVVTLYKS